MAASICGIEFVGLTEQLPIFPNAWLPCSRPIPGWGEFGSIREAIDIVGCLEVLSPTSQSEFDKSVKESEIACILFLLFLSIDGSGGRGLFDIDECTTGTDNCDDDATCTNTDSGFTCACNAGYSGDGVTCIDINECTTGTDNCHDDATCANTVGSFICSCNDGYAGDGVSCDVYLGRMPTWSRQRR
ncbi:hypothetical protein Bbelb_224090 [Branchiostoma belcheri]|nr:hypothetical protein Bbelb_224090 [Branchiostoma belcheri]